MKTTKVLLLGAGPMAVEYAKVLDHLGIDFSVKGRGAESAKNFQARTGKVPLLSWGEVDEVPSFTHCIVAVSEESLLDVTLELAMQGANKILVEKPGAPSIEDMGHNISALTAAGLKVYIAYNRRYYKIIEMLLDQIKLDGGITSIHFDFSERSRVVGELTKAPGVKENWLFHNSTHVLDLVLYISNGAEIDTALSASSLPWHPSGSRFSGVGKTSTGGLLTYNSDWESPGGWEILVRTKHTRFQLKPLETLVVTCSSGETETFEEKCLSNPLYKFGILEMVRDFLIPVPSSRLLSVRDQLQHLEFFSKIGQGLK
jgi:predicted dehydrogenase